MDLSVKSDLVYHLFLIITYIKMKPQLTPAKAMFESNLQNEMQSVSFDAIQINDHDLFLIQAPNIASQRDFANLNKTTIVNPKLLS